MGYQKKISTISEERVYTNPSSGGMGYQNEPSTFYEEPIYDQSSF
jgi:hypothetical protein